MHLEQHHQLSTKKQTTTFWIRHKVIQFLTIPLDSERSQGDKELPSYKRIIMLV
jgi:hypothetical protein